MTRPLSASDGLYGMSRLVKHGLALLLAGGLVFQAIPAVMARSGANSGFSNNDSGKLAFIPRLETKNGLAPASASSHDHYAMQSLDADSQMTASAAPGMGTLGSRDSLPDEGQALKGNITTLRVTRGRSQIIKFAQPIMRLSITDPSLADVIPLSPDQIMINGKLRGVTSLIVWDESGQEGIFDLYVENDTSELLKAIEAIAPNEKIEARVTDDSFVISGQVSNSVILDEIRKTAAAYGYRDDKFVDLTETPVPQVILEVKIVEAEKSFARDLKSSFILTDNSGLTLNRLANPIDSGLLKGVNAATQGLVPGLGLLDPRTKQAGSNVAGLTGGARPFNWAHGTGSLDIFWDAIESSGRASVLAEPNLVCTHGRTAEFFAGGEIPVPTSVDQNGNPVITFKDFGVRLKFTPWISYRTGRIELKLQPEISRQGTANCALLQGLQVCPFIKRTVDSTVELKDGETLMIAGILQKQESQSFARIPWIGQVPILGQLFSNMSSPDGRGLNKVDSELIVIVTPRIVKPGDYGHILGKPL